MNDIDVAGINSAPVISNLPLSTPVTVQENSPLSSSVYQVLITDVDLGQNHTFQVHSTPSIGSTLFSIDSTSKKMMLLLKTKSIFKILNVHLSDIAILLFIEFKAIVALVAV